MSNVRRGGAGGFRQASSQPSTPVQVQKVVAAGIERAKAPGNSLIVPIQGNSTAERGGPVGGFGDADRMAQSRTHRKAPTARKGQDPSAAATMGHSMGAPTPYPGQKGAAKPVPTAPPRLANASTATGPAAASGETTLRRMANLSRNGGSLGMNDATRMRAPSLPTPSPSFPKADNPGGSPTQQPLGGGTMHGVMRRGRGQPSAGNA